MRNNCSDESFPPVQRAALRDLLMQTVAQVPSAGPHRTRYVVAGIAALAIATTGAAVGAQLIGSSSVTNKHTALCYSSVSTDTSSNFPGTTIAEAGTATSSGAVTDAAAVCAALWRAGILQPGVAGVVNRPSSQHYRVPALAACVLADGRAAIFPGPAGTCQRLGLPPAPRSLGEGITPG